MPQMICPKCNSLVQVAPYCAYCRTKLTTQPSSQSSLPGLWQQFTSGQKAAGGIAALVILVIIIAIINGRNRQPTVTPTQRPDKPTSTRASDSDKPLEYKLAVINANGFVPENDITVTRFRFLLETLQKKTGYTQQQIADVAVQSQNLIRSKYGKQVKLLELMEEGNRIVSLNPNLKYQEVMASIVVNYGQ